MCKRTYQRVYYSSINKNNVLKFIVLRNKESFEAFVF